MRSTRDRSCPGPSLAADGGKPPLPFFTTSTRPDGTQGSGTQLRAPAVCQALESDNPDAAQMLPTLGAPPTTLVEVGRSSGVFCA